MYTEESKPLPKPDWCVLYSRPEKPHVYVNFSQIW